MQGDCGSCWAFSTAGVIEAYYKINFGSSLTFSPQHLVDCDKTDHGCDGGFPTNALNYIKKNGIYYDSSYPYTSKITGMAGKCIYSSEQSNFVVSSFTKCPLDSCNRSRIFSMLANGPIIAVMDASSPKLQHYTSGILDYKCTSDIYNHAVNIVGVSSDNIGGYYIVRNSWGSSWGENGYFRMRLNDASSTCLLETNAWTPVLKKTNIPPPAPIPQCTSFYSECNLMGTKFDVCQSQAKFVNFDGRIKGFSKGNATTVDLFDSENCLGSYFSYKDDLGCFSNYGLSSFINNVRSAIIDWKLQSPPKGCIWVYSGCCFLSERLEICSNIPDLSKASSNFDNKINAIRLGPGVSKVILATGVQYSGTLATYSGSDDVPCVSSSILNKASSIKIKIS